MYIIWKRHFNSDFEEIPQRNVPKTLWTAQSNSHTVRKSGFQIGFRESICNFCCIQTSTIIFNMKKMSETFQNFNLFSSLWRKALVPCMSKHQYILAIGKKATKVWLWISVILNMKNLEKKYLSCNTNTIQIHIHFND